MDFVDVQLPKRIALGAQRQATWSTTIIRTISGKATSIQNRARALHRWDISFAVRSAADYNEIVAHFHSVRGRAKLFPFDDALDNSLTASQGVMYGDGDSPEVYQLHKRYGSGASAYDRKITRPVAGTVAVYRTRTGVTTAITSLCTIDHDSGTLTIDGVDTVQMGDVLSWSGQFRVPCHYDTDQLPALTINRRPGAAGELLVQCNSIQIVEGLE